jgi:hypothetical protein
MFLFSKPVSEAPLHAASALLIAAMDWLVFGLNIATTMHAYWLVDVGTALVAGALVILAQRYATDGWQPALLKGAVAAVVVAIPLPVAGTVLALVALTWGWMSAVSR